MEHEGEIKILAIAGGMDGIFYYNDIKLNTIK
jgi:hypothetical protein